MSEAGTIRVIPAGPNEVRQLTLLMPDAADAPTRYRFFAATRDGKMLGGAALTAVPGGARALFQVALTEGASSKAGDMLVHAMKVFARREGAELLVYEGGAMEGSRRAQMLERCSFIRRGAPISHFSLRTDAPELRRFFDTYEKLKKRGKMPAEAQVLPLNQLAGVAVSELLRRTVGVAGGKVHAEMLNSDTFSLGILNGSSLVAVIVGSVCNGEAHISHLAVDPAHRGLWAYSALIAESLRRSRARGVTRCTFRTNPGIHRAILNVARALHAEHAGDERTWVFPLQDSQRNCASPFR